jgi:hypothetical protein
MKGKRLLLNGIHMNRRKLFNSRQNIIDEVVWTKQPFLGENKKNLDVSRLQKLLSTSGNSHQAKAISWNMVDSKKSTTHLSFT